MSYEVLDRRLKRYSARLVEAVGLDSHEASRLATLVAAEIRFLEPSARTQIVAASPVPLRDRLDELRAFQSWMDLVSRIRGNPEVSRAQLVVQNYVCFV
jgi:hypothetical protein